MRTRIAPQRAIHGARPRTPAEDISRLMQLVVVTEYGCWEFQGQRDAKGYGRFTVGGNKELAHRGSWALRFGDPGDQCVLHRCDNPPCVNPHHLFLGSIAENNADMAAKGRAHKTGLSGERHHQAKLTTADVLAIRSSQLPVRKLVGQYGISDSQIRAIRSRRAWRHVA